MSGFAYFTGEKWVENLTMNDIRALAMTGVITETTLIRNPDGQEKEAKFCGLVFSDKQSQLAEFLKGGDGSQTEDESILAPTIAIIEMMYYLVVTGAALSGFAAVLGLLFATAPQTGYFGLMLSAGSFLSSVSFIFIAMLVTVLKYLVMGFDSMERTFRKIEKTMRKEDK